MESGIWAADNDRDGDGGGSDRGRGAAHLSVLGGQGRAVGAEKASVSPPRAGAQIQRHWP